jgi:hypothetical protein
MKLLIFIQSMEDLLLGLVADGAGVVEDEAGVGFVGGLGVALVEEGADDFFGVVGVHLAAEGFDVKGLHRNREGVFIGRVRRTNQYKSCGLAWTAKVGSA